jgi:transcriptional regulator with XRE-family HTH domain
MTISAIERRVEEPTVKRLKKLARALGVDIAELIQGGQVTMIFLIALLIVFGIGGLISYPMVRANRRREAEKRDREQRQAIEHVERLRRQAKGGTRDE